MGNWANYYSIILSLLSSTDEVSQKKTVIGWLLVLIDWKPSDSSTQLIRSRAAKDPGLLMRAANSHRQTENPAAKVIGKTDELETHHKANQMAQESFIREKHTRICSLWAHRCIASATLTNNNNWCSIKSRFTCRRKLTVRRAVTRYSIIGAFSRR